MLAFESFVERNFSALVSLHVGTAVFCFVLLFFVSAPYGKHYRAGWGPSMNARIGFILQEAPAALIPLFVFFLRPAPVAAPSLVLFALWSIHYLNRAFIYPVRAKFKNPTTVIVVLSAVYFNLVNASLIAYSLFNTPPAPLPRLFLGAVVMTIGWGTPPSSFDDTAAINYNADAILRSLRTPSDSSYKIPRGGAFEFVSAANYFGETVEWGGFALAAASTPAWVFFLWTVANLAPRARSTHVWYRKTFKNYPPNRRAFIPFLW